MSSRFNPRTDLTSNRIGKQIEAFVNPPNNPVGVHINETDLFAQGLKDRNIGSVNTPDQQTGNNNRSMTLSFENNNPKSGSKPFTLTTILDTVNDPQREEYSPIGFQYQKGNYKIFEDRLEAERNADDTIPINRVMQLSKTYDVVNTTSRPQNYNSFVNQPRRR